MGLTFSRNTKNDDLTSYIDSDFAGLKDKKYSTDDYVFILSDRVILYSSKQQPTIALSSCEAK